MIKSFIKNFLILLLFVFIFLAIFQVQRKNELTEIKNRKVLLVGTTGDYRPMSYFDKETKEYIGFDIALAEDLAASLGVKIKFIPTSWPTLTNDTISGKFDIALCGITITDARKKEMLMSDGYLDNGKTILCRKEDADKYTSLNAINHSNVKIMENPGGQNEEFVKKNLPKAELIIHNKNEEIPDLIASAQADVMITEILEANFYSARNAKLIAPTINAPFNHSQIGALLPKKNKALLKYFNKFLKKERKTGRLEELVNIYIK